MSKHLSSLTQKRVGAKQYSGFYYLIVGSGLYGAVFAHLATKKGKK